jgi:hypothetical protein
MKRARVSLALTVMRWLAWAAWATWMWVTVDGSLLDYWPAFLVGACVAAFPVVVIAAWTAYRGDRLGRL